MNLGLEKEQVQSSLEFAKPVNASSGEKFTIFVPPELAASSVDDDISGYDKKPTWDIAVRYQDLKRLMSLSNAQKKKFSERAVEGVIARARQVLGSVVRPETFVSLNYDEFHQGGYRGELDLLSTLNEGLGTPGGLTEKSALRFEGREAKKSRVLLLMDASLSMNGEKIALLAVAVAVVGLCLPATDIGLISFSSRSKILKNFGATVPLQDMVRAVLDMPAFGLTNLEAALRSASDVLESAHDPRINVILISDGKYTEGKDPSYLASRFRRLSALKVGRDIAGRALLQDLVRGGGDGGGSLFEARRYVDLPQVLYKTLRHLLR